MFIGPDYRYSKWTHSDQASEPNRPGVNGYYAGGIFYRGATSIADAQKRHRKHLRERRNLANQLKKQEAEKLAQENAKFQGIGFLEGLKLASMELAERKMMAEDSTDHRWAQDYHIYTNPEQLCCYCGTGIQTKRVWFFDKDKKKVLAVIKLDGTAVPSLGWHPHVNGGRICVGRDDSVDGATALFLGLNPGSAFINVKDWLVSQLDHKCWWTSTAPHYCDPMSWAIQACGCRTCTVCKLPICKCTGNLLSRQIPIPHPIPPMTREAFDELVQWAERARVAYQWDEKTTMFNANYIASLPVEPLVEQTTTTTTVTETIEGGNVNEHGTGTTTNADDDPIEF